MSKCEPSIQLLDHISKYNYFDTPDGYDIHLKIFYCVKQAFRIGTLFIVQDVLAISRPAGWLPILDRLVYLYKPWISCSLTYPVVANVSCLVRQKDDYWNHVLAAAVTTWVFGRFVGGAIGTILLVPAVLGAGWFKQSTLEGYRAIPMHMNRIGEVHHYSMSIKTHTKQHGMFAQRPKSWTSLENYMSQQ